MRLGRHTDSSFCLVHNLLSINSAGDKIRGDGG